MTKLNSACPATGEVATSGVTFKLHAPVQWISDNRDASDLRCNLVKQFETLAVHFD
jgi:hypothetical protein